MKTLYTITFLLLTTVDALAQHPTLVCGFDYFMQMKKQHDQVYYWAYNDMFRQWKEVKNDNRGGGDYTLPVVFHIVYNMEEQNIADSVVLSQIDVLNEDYRRLNADAINTRDIFEPIAADCHIQFQLATTDPDGNPTTGITHTLTDRAGFEIDFFAQENTLDEVKYGDSGGIDAWDPEHYINIWVCNIEASIFGQVFGMSYPPADLDNWPAGSNAPNIGDEGIIVHYTTVGRNNPTASNDGTDDNNKGRTLTHEMGHYLGLRHTWGDELFTDVCSEDDGIDDTPICASGDQYSCDYEANTCDDGTLEDQPDMLENYMDYTKDICYNMFTNDQKSLMRYVVEEIRNDLLDGVAFSVGKETKQEVSIYPNPASDNLYIRSSYFQAGSSYTIMDQLGQSVSSGTLTHTVIDITHLSPGVYVLNISDKHLNSSSRFIVK